VPEIADIALHNLEIFKELQKLRDINYRQTRYVTFAHDDDTYEALDAAREWSEAYMVEPKDYPREISPNINPGLGKIYPAAQISLDCWQATPGRVIDLIRRIGIESGGRILEDCQLIDVRKNDGKFNIIIRNHEKQYLEYHVNHFVNALGPEADKFARQTGIETGLFPVKHQAFITRRLPNLGINDQPLDMLIDRRKYKGFSAVYGQQLSETGQIIGCASPLIEPTEVGKNLKINSKEFLEIVSEVFVDWIPQLSSVGFQAVWAGYYVEPRMIIDPELGLFTGLRGHGFMLSQYLAKLYVAKLLEKPTPDYFNRLKLSGDGMLEKAFK
jgi:glycine/D-amino acid oxidase-like deaminating enzyme